MAWKKVTLDEEENLYCDISDEDIQAAVHDLKNQLKDAGIVLIKKPDQRSYHQKGTARKKSVSRKAASLKTAPAMQTKKIYSTTDVT